MIILIRLLKIFLQGLYLPFWILPARNKVVMISRQADQPGLDFTLLDKALSPSYTVVTLCKTLEGRENARVFAQLRYGLHMIRQLYHLATSRVCVLDSFCPAVSMLRHKKSLTVVQMWHSNGTMKNFGYSALGKEEGASFRLAKAMNMHRGYDLVLCSGKAYSAHLCAGFGVSPDVIRIYTLPRFDLLHDPVYAQKTRTAVYEAYPMLKEKQTVVYAPTFREDGQADRLSEKLQELVDCFDFQRYRLVVKAHPLQPIRLSDPRVIVDRRFSTFDMLFAADKLITDYSCVLYEAGAAGIPLYFYAYDLEDYRRARGLALDYETLPGFTEQTAPALVRDLEKPYDTDALKRFVARYVENTENCTAKLAALIAQCMKKQEAKP